MTMSGESGNIGRKKSAKKSLLERELLLHCQSETISEEGLREIIETPNHYNLRRPRNHHVDVENYIFFHEACKNERVTEGIIQCILEHFPDAANTADGDGRSPLYCACNNKNVTLGIIQLLLDAAPDSVRSETNTGWTCLHRLCANEKVDEATAIQICKLLIEKHPEAVGYASNWHRKNGGFWPIHRASKWRSPEFCRLLIDKYPGSERMTTTNGRLPLHYACSKNSLAMVEYLYHLYPEAIDHASTGGYHPIHVAIGATKRRENPAAAVEIVRFLLNCDPNQKLKKFQRVSLLHYACGMEYYVSDIETGIRAIEVIYDAHPESVRVVNEEGHTPLHILCGNTRQVDEAVALQILKFLLEKYPDAVQHADNNGFLPIHRASWWRSPAFCRVLIEAYPGSERISTNYGGLPLHIACFEGSLATVEYLYKLYPNAIHHATTNGKHPIHNVISHTRRRENPATAVDIVQFLLDCDPDQKLIQFHGMSLLHYACAMDYDDSDSDAVIEMIKVIFIAHPGSVSSLNNDGNMPLHSLCRNVKVDEAVAIQILKFLLEKNPDSVRHADRGGRLPIHFAAGRRSPEFCHVLIEAYPGSERISDARGVLPLHNACAINSLATVEYFYRRYPDAIVHATIRGQYPIFYSVGFIVRSELPKADIESIRFLLDCDPRVKTQSLRGWSLLRLACGQQFNDSNIHVALQMIKVIYDAHPEAIEDNRITTDIRRYHQQVQEFINSQLVHVRLAKDQRLRRRMTTPDGNGQLLLHRAVQNNVTLGSIKLLVKGNPAAILSPDNSGALPLHFAFQHDDSASIVRYLVGLDPSTLDAVDREGNSALHLACRGAKYDTIAMLLEKYDAISVSKRNTDEKLPIDLLWESNAVEDRGSVEYMGSVFQLLKAYPETVMNNAVKNVTQQVEFGACSSQNAKKRKRDTA